MRGTQTTLFVLGLLILSTQTFRHVYVKWIAPTTSVLDEYRPEVEAEIAATKDLDELVALYDEAWKRVQEFEKTATPEQQAERWQEEPYESERSIRGAIERWEAQGRALFEFRFYWAAGLVSILLGLLAYARVNRWLGMVGLITGFTEMAFWTSPLWHSWGPQSQFERLLNEKLIFSLVSTALLIGLWLWRTPALRRRGAVVAGLGLLLLATPARADEAASFPTPSTERAFAFDLDVVAGDTVVGTAHLEARAEAQEGSHWHILESLEAGEGEDAVALRLDAWLDASLDPLRGRTSEGVGSDPLVHAFRRAGGAFNVQVTGDGREARTRQAERPGHAVVGLTSLVLLAREVAGQKGTYATRLFAPDWEYLVAEEPFVEVRIEVGPGRWRGRDVHRLHLTSPADDRQATVLLDPESRALLYAHWLPPGGPAFDLRPAAEEEAPSPVVAAAMRATLAFLTADKALFEKAVHWPKLQEYGKSYVRGKVTAEAFKKAILEQFEKNLPPPLPVEEARRRIEEAKEAFSVESKGDDRAVVTLPASIAPMRLTLERIDGVWYLVRLPHG